MNKVNNEETPHLNVLNQYIKDLSYENFQKNVDKTNSIKDNKTSIDIKVIYKHHDENHFEVLIKITIICESKKNKTIIFQLELDYLGLFKVENIQDFDRDKLSSEGAKIIFPEDCLAILRKYLSKFLMGNISDHPRNIKHENVRSFCYLAILPSNPWNIKPCLSDLVSKSISK